MRRQRGYLFGVLGVAVAMLSMVAALEAQVVQTAAAPQGVDPGTVNRTLKGNRLPLVPGATGANPAELLRAREPKLPAGCDEANAPRSPFAAEVAGRCLAQAPTDRRHFIVGQEPLKTTYSADPGVIVPLVVAKLCPGAVKGAVKSNWAG